MHRCRQGTGVLWTNPMLGIYAAVMRQDASGNPAGGFHPEQRVSRMEALKMYTSSAAYAAFEEDIKGTLTPGKLADITVLSKDILSIPAPRDSRDRGPHDDCGWRDRLSTRRVSGVGRSRAKNERSHQDADALVLLPCDTSSWRRQIRRTYRRPPTFLRSRGNGPE